MSLYPTIFRSTDPGAPVISGQAGALAALLDAILVDGYGSGATAKGGLGWTREFVSPNLRAYRNNPVTGTGYFLRVDDSNALYGWMRGYESMSAISTGINPVPTLAQRTDGSMWIKSSAAGAVARSWFAIGNERSLYLFIDHTGGGAESQVPYFCGDISSYLPGDQHCFALSQNGMTAYTSGIGSNITFYPSNSSWDVSSLTTVNSGLYLARNSALAAGALHAGVANMNNTGTLAVWGGGTSNSYYNIPPPVNGGVISQPGLLLERPFLFRGQYPGLRVPISTLGYGDGWSIDGVVIAKRFTGTSSGNNSVRNVGEVLFELDREWD